MNQHIPRVKIVTPEPDRLGMTPAIFNHLTVDGQEWAIVDYTVRGHVDGLQHVTLTFLGNVTIEHPAAAPDDREGR